MNQENEYLRIFVSEVMNEAGQTYWDVIINLTEKEKGTEALEVLYDHLCDALKKGEKTVWIRRTEGVKSE